MKLHFNTHLIVFFFVFLVQGCSQHRYHLKHDGPPDTATLPQGATQTLMPVLEPLSLKGNMDYTHNKQHYAIWHDLETYETQGIASWYGRKFHGYSTSNGEQYNMYALSAAHRNLPLPSYVEVTNLDNQKSIVVRVNDRGPFHPDRIIDLSYGAAHALDMLEKGTAKVKLKLIPSATLASSKEEIYIRTSRMIQLLTTDSKERAQTLADALHQQYKKPTRIQSFKKLYRVQLGPLPLEQAHTFLDLLRQEGYHHAYFVD